jgi:hypothetical protein
MDSTSSDRFTYKPLYPDRYQIRLLKLLPGKKGPVKCKLYHVDPEYPRRYRAVSYTWGPPTLQREIIVNGKRFDVGENLWHFLDTLRRLPDIQIDSKAGLWIDQICIDQSCPEERSTQVRLMEHIYSNAHVLAWLGPASRDSSLAVSSIIDPPPGFSLRVSYEVPPTLSHEGPKELSLTRSGVPWVSPSAEEVEWSNIFAKRLSDVMKLWGGTVGVPLRDSTASVTRPEIAPAEQAVQDLLSRRYWSRLWIVQELVLARDIAFFCGNDCFYLSQLTDFLNLIDGWFYQKAIRNVCYRRYLRYQAHPFEEEINTTLANVLFDLCEAECQDPRDKVFGLQALVIAYDRVEVDYSASTTDVFLTVVHNVLETEREDHAGFDPEYESYVKLSLHQLARSMGIMLPKDIIDKIVDFILTWKALSTKGKYTIRWLSRQLRKLLKEV